MTANVDERMVLAAALLAVAAARIALGGATTPSDPGEPGSVSRPDADDYARALAVSTEVLGGLSPGDRVGDLRVERVSEPRDGAIAVELTDGEEHGLRVWVTRRGARPHTASASTAEFDLWYGQPPPGHAMVSHEMGQAVVDALAARISEADPEVPAELR